MLNDFLFNEIIRNSQVKRFIMEILPKNLEENRQNLCKLQAASLVWLKSKNEGAANKQLFPAVNFYRVSWSQTFKSQFWFYHENFFKTRNLQEKRDFKTALNLTTINVFYDEKFARRLIRKVANSFWRSKMQTMNGKFEYIYWYRWRGRWHFKAK